MPRMSKERKQEWALFLNERNRITYNDLCRKCSNDCKQSFRCIVVLCPIYTGYRKAGYSKKYYDAHESDIIIHKAAKKAFDELALKKLPTVKSLQAEYSNLLVQKKLDYAALAKAREEARQLQIYKANAEMLLHTDADEQRQAREHQQEK